MTPETGVIIGAAIAGGTAIVGNLLALVGVRSQATAAVVAARMEADAAWRTDVTAKRQAAYARVGAITERMRQQLRELDGITLRLVATPADAQQKRQDFAAALAPLLDLEVEIQEAEWSLRMMIDDDEQELLNGVMATVRRTGFAMRDWNHFVARRDSGDATVDQDVSLARTEYQAANLLLHDRLMEFARSSHKRLYAERSSSPARRWFHVFRRP